MPPYGDRAVPVKGALASDHEGFVITEIGKRQ
jgi:hypothetical protein